MESDRRAGLEDFSAQAVATAHPGFTRHEVRRQALVGKQMEDGRIRRIEADRARVGAEGGADAGQETLAEKLDRRLLAEEGGDLVEDAQFAVALGKAARLRLDPLFQRRVKRLQVRRHLVEAVRQIPQLVVGADRQPHRQVALAHAPHAGVQFRDRTDHQQHQEADHDARADHRENDQRRLHAAQQVRVGGIAVFHRQHQVVDAGDEGFHFAVELLPEANPCLALPGDETRHQRPHRALPGFLDAVQFLLDLGIARRRQRTGRITPPQILQHPVEALDLGRQAADGAGRVALGREAALHQVGHAISAACAGCRRR